MLALRQIIGYLISSRHHGFQIFSSSSSLISYIDVDRCVCVDNCIFLSDNLLSCSFKKQATMSRSSAEAKYRRVANVSSESCWLPKFVSC